MEQGPDVVGAELEQAFGGAEQPHHILMRDAGAFGLAGRARGVDDVGGVLRLQARRRRDRKAPGYDRPVRVQAHDARTAGGQPVEQGRVRDQHGRMGVFHHVGQTLRRVGWIERQISAAGLEDADEPDEHFERALDT